MNNTQIALSIILFMAIMFSFASIASIHETNIKDRNPTDSLIIIIITSLLWVIFYMMRNYVANQ